MKKILRMSTHAAILFMVVCVLLGVVLGNRNALNKAVANAEKGFYVVEERMKDRIGKAKILLSKASEYNPGDGSTKALTEAIAQAEKAKGIKAIAAADTKIADAADDVYNAFPSSMNAADRRYVAAAWDEMKSVNNEVLQSKRDFNEGFQEAIEVYRKLPSRWLLKNPEGVRI